MRILQVNYVLNASKNNVKNFGAGSPETSKNHKITSIYIPFAFIDTRKNDGNDNSISFNYKLTNTQKINKMRAAAIKLALYTTSINYQPTLVPICIFSVNGTPDKRLLHCICQLVYFVSKTIHKYEFEQHKFYTIKKLHPQGVNNQHNIGVVVL